MNDEVRDVIREWLAKASADWLVVEILTRESSSPRAAICFHCQQHVEKLLKALLTCLGIEAPRTHSLRYLIQLAAPRLPALTDLIDRADLLSVHAIESRYPDDWREIPESEASDMVALSRDFHGLITPFVSISLDS